MSKSDENIRDVFRHYETVISPLIFGYLGAVILFPTILFGYLDVKEIHTWQSSSFYIICDLIFSYSIFSIADNPKQKRLLNKYLGREPLGEWNKIKWLFKRFISKVPAFSLALSMLCLHLLHSLSLAAETWLKWPMVVASLFALAIIRFKEKSILR